MKAYHVTDRARALVILAHGFTEANEVHVAGEVYGIRLQMDPAQDFNPSIIGKFRVVSVDGEAVGPDLESCELDDQDEWVQMPTHKIHDPIGDTVIELEFPDGALDEWRYEEGIVLWNRRTKEIRATEQFAWSGEWAPPLALVQGAPFRLLERDLSEEEEAELGHYAAQYRALLEDKGLADEEIDRRLSAYDERNRKWEPEDGRD